MNHHNRDANKAMRHTRLMTTLSAAALLTGAAAPAFAAPFLVTSNADSGEGSLRAALQSAAADGETSTIFVVAEGDIVIESTLTYDGEAPVVIYGRDHTVSTDANTTLFAATAGADVAIYDMAFEGPGGFSIENRGDSDGDAGKGIFVDVRENQTGIVTLQLGNVTVSGVANHGVHVSDCDLADDCGSGGGGAGGGSPASINVVFEGVTISDVGNGKFDADGLRVDERDEGGIRLVSRNSTYTLVGADGVELDEGQAGSVVAANIGDSFTDNGAYCDPDILMEFMPDEPEGEFAQGEVQEADIPGDVTGTPDDGCFEREVSTYDDGSVEEYEIGIDLDDGFDIDEAGDGDLRSVVVGVSITGNLDEGLDYDEEDAGEIDLAIWRSTAEGNTDDGYKSSEAGPGGVVGLMIGSAAHDNGGVGAVFEAEDGGAVNVAVANSQTSGNDGGELGLEAVNEGDDGGRLVVRASTIEDGIVAEGVERVEE